MEEKNVDLLSQLQRLTTTTFVCHPKNGQKRKRVSNINARLLKARNGYQSILFISVILNSFLKRNAIKAEGKYAYIRLIFDWV